MKDNGILFRLTKEQKIVFKQYCHSKGITLSNFIIDSCILFIKNNPSSSTQEQKIIDRFQREEKLSRSRIETKRKMHDRYIIRNWIRRIYNVVQADMLNGDGKIECMKEIKDMVKDAMNEFKLLDKTMQRRQKNSFKNLKNWLSEEWIYKKFEKIKMIPYEEKRRLLGQK